MPLTYPYADCPWQVWHRPRGEKTEHPAFRLRSFMVGDFSPGRTIRGGFVIRQDGTPGERHQSTRCETCGDAAFADYLEVEERASGQRHYLGLYRRGGRTWPAGTLDRHCWWCQAPDVARDGLCEACVKFRDEG